MSRRWIFPPLPYLLLGLMTLLAFGGPFLMVAVILGGEDSRWPPDRPIEWIVTAATVGSVVLLLVSCVTLGAWYRWPTSETGSLATKPSHAAGKAECPAPLPSEPPETAA
jgi:hypothetical protein